MTTPPSSSPSATLRPRLLLSCAPRRSGISELEAERDSAVKRHDRRRQCWLGDQAEIGQLKIRVEELEAALREIIEARELKLTLLVREHRPPRAGAETMTTAPAFFTHPLVVIKVGDIIWSHCRKCMGQTDHLTLATA